jgi:hypothetical protein
MYPKCNEGAKFELPAWRGDTLKRITFISWALFQRRSELLAQHLKTTAHFIYLGHKGNLLQAPVRFPVQSRRTWRVLRSERLDVVFVQPPHPLCFGALPLRAMPWRAIYH